MKLQLPNLDDLIQALSKVVKRFPLSLAVALIGTVIAIIGIENEIEDELFGKLIMTALLALPLFTAIKLLVESHKWGFVKSIVLNGIGFLLLLFFFFQFQEEIQYREVARFLALNLTFHLAVAVFPYIKKHDEDSFWYFNQYIFIRILTAGLYSIVIFGGLALAMGAVQVLFDIEIDGQRYPQLLAIIGGVFNTTFFLAGVPDRFQFDYKDDRYPKGLKVFAKYVLIPLCAVYLVILYLYGGKIMLEWDWPNGWITWLVFGFALLGTLAYLLVAPLGRNEENQWVYNFCKWFFILIVPLSIMQLLAIYRRVDEYGLTENRYFVALLGITLIVLAGYFVFSKVKSLKVIPLVLGSLSFLSVMGPWNAFQVSFKSQVTEVLSEIQLYGESDDEDQKNKLSENIESRVDFLLDRKTDEEVYGLLGLEYPEETSDNFYGRNEILKDLKVDAYEADQTYASYWLEAERNIDIEGFDNLKFIDGYAYSDDGLPVFKQGILTMKIDSLTVEIEAQTFLQNLRKSKPNEPVTAQQMTLPFENDKLTLKVVFRNLSLGSEDQEQFVVNSFDGYLLWRMK